MPIYFLDEMKWKYLEAEIAKRGALSREKEEELIVKLLAS